METNVVESVWLVAIWEKRGNIGRQEGTKVAKYLCFIQDLESGI